MFKNLSFYRLPEQFTAPEDFDELLQPLALKPLGSVDFATRGFVSPIPDHSGLSHTLQGACMVRLGIEEKVLPSSLIAQELDRRVRAIEQRDGRRPGKKTREQLKDDIVADFMKRAFVRSSAITAYIDEISGVLVVNSTSERAAEKLISALRGALTTFAVEPWQPGGHLGVVMSQWLVDGQCTHGFQLADAVELTDPVERQTTVKAKRHDLTSEEIRQHAQAGKQVSQLALIFDDRLSFTLDTQFKVRGLRFLDCVMDDLGDGGGDVVGEFDARFALMTLEVRRLVKALREVAP
jgi:recombination associated protein RdgC